MNAQMMDSASDVLKTVNGHKWKRIGLDPKAGVLVALWSLRTMRNAGIGEVLDLELLVDWCVQTGQKIIQLLPVTDTAYDAPPYCSSSAFALNPAYLSLHDIPGVDLGELEKLRNEFDPLERIVYWKIRGEKMRLLWGAYEKVLDRLGRDEGFRRFCSDSSYWLDTYAAFMVMKDKHEQKSWKTWEDAPGSAEFADMGPDMGPGIDNCDNSIVTIVNTRPQPPGSVREVVRRHAHEAGFYRFLQWHLDRQWRRVRAYANDRGVFIKGDIPYLLNNDAADVWAYPKFFHMDKAAGCPPDFYVKDGQYWSFPTYRWDEIERDGCRWWFERLRAAEKYFDIFRIDHVLGFFRIWTIPSGAPAILGQYVPAVHVTRDHLRKNDICPDDEENLLRRNILLPAVGTEGEYAFKWKFVDDRAFETLPDHLKSSLRRLESYFSENDEIQNDLWREHGKKWLGLLSKNTEMLICAEDLGTVPPCVRPTLEELGIPKLLVDRWTKFCPTKKEKERGFQEYWIEPWEYDPISVSSPSNHDMPSLRGWWMELGETEEGRKERWEHFNRFGWRGEMPDQLNAGGVRFILKRNLEGRSVFTIFPIQDILDLNPRWQSRNPAEDRINLPGTFSDKNWSWRMRISLERLCEEKDFNLSYAQLVKDSGRA